MDNREINNQTPQEIKKKKKWIVPVIIGVAAALLIGLIVGGIIYIKSVALPKKELKKQLDLGDKYLSDMDYDNAILAYREAISINPKNEKAYLGLGKTYEAMADEALDEGDVEKALDCLSDGIKALKNGYGNTGSEEIKEELDRMKEKKKEVEEDNGVSGDNADERTRAAYEAFLNHLSSDSSYDLRDYNGHSEVSVSFSNVFGDDTPEMICVCEQIHPDYDFTNRILNIYTLKDGSLQKLIDDYSFEKPVAGGEHVCLFKNLDTGKLYYIEDWGDETWETNINTYEEKRNSLESKNLLSETSGPNDDYSAYVTQYYKEGRTVSEDEFRNEYKTFIQNIEMLYWCEFYTSSYHDDEFSIKANITTNSCMTYSDAIAFLNDWLSSHPAQNEKGKGKTDKGKDKEDTQAQTDDYAIFSKVNTSYTFCSGAGGWGTGLTLNPDGTFEASYSDSDMGDSGNGYDATIYVSSCTGKFGKPEKINDYTYKLTLESLNYTCTVGEEKIVNRVREITTDLYGIGNGKTFYLYLKGSNISDLPKEFVDWMRMPLAISDSDKTLPFDGLYNADEKLGFSSY